MKILKDAKFDLKTNLLKLELEEVPIHEAIYVFLKLLFKLFSYVFITIFIFKVFSIDIETKDFFNLLVIYTFTISALQLIKVVLYGVKFLPSMKYDFGVLLFLIFIILSILIKQLIGIVPKEGSLITANLWHMSVWGFLLFSLFAYMLFLNFEEVKGTFKLLDWSLFLSLILFFLRLILSSEISQSMWIFMLLLLPVYMQKLLGDRCEKIILSVIKKRFKIKSARVIVLFIRFVILSAIITIFVNNFSTVINDVKSAPIKSLTLGRILLGGEVVNHHPSTILNFLASYGLINTTFLLVFLAYVFNDIRKAYKKDRMLKLNLSVLASIIVFLLTSVFVNFTAEIFILELFLLVIFLFNIEKSKAIKIKLLKFKLFRKRIYVLRGLQFLLSSLIVIGFAYIIDNLDKIFYP